MLDLFCGAGGFSVGASWAGFFPVVGLDYLRPAIETWQRNHPHSISALGDIRETDAFELRNLLAARGVRHINLITGGVPCQGFSIANRKHNDEDPRNFLFLEYLRFVDAFQPDYAILENVSGMRSTAGGRFEAEISRRMQALGYLVTVKLVNAADYGVPQQRHRLLFVAVRNRPAVAKPYDFPDGAFASVRAHRTVGEAISDLPRLGNHEFADAYDTPPQSVYQSLMRGAGDIANISPPEKLTNHHAPNHPASTIAKIDNTAPGMPIYPKFRQRIRLAANAPSPTQLAGGIRPQYQFGHPDQPRGETVRERARLQSFPDSYEFLGGTVQSRVLTGNAVPPLMVYEVVKPIVADLQHRDRISSYV